MLVHGFNMHIYAESLTPGSTERQDTDMACFKYASDITSVELRISTSFISDEQAVTSLHRECPASMSFDSVALVAKNTWNK